MNLKTQASRPLLSTLSAALPVAFAAVFSVLPLRGFAQENPRPLPGAPAAVPAPVMQQFSGLIAAIDPASKTITLGDANRNSPKVRIVAGTRITRGSKAAAWESLTVGMKVEGTMTDTGAVAATLNILD